MARSRAGTRAKVRLHSRNLLVLCGSNFFFMSSYLTSVNLQSSLNTNLGLTSLAVLYASYSLSSFISPTVIKILNTKWTIVITSILHCAFIAVNIYPKLYTLLPVALLVGLSAGPLWTAQGKHLTTTAINLALLTKENASTTISRSNGLFYLFFIACLIPGNIISSLALHDGKIYGGIHYTSINQCGANDCNDGPRYSYRLPDIKPPVSWYGHINSTRPANNSHLYSEVPADEQTRFILFATLLGWGLLGSLLAMLLLDSLKSFCKIVPQPKQFREHSLVVLKVMRHGHFIMMVPLIAFTSLEVGFTYTTFAKSYITCSLGVQNVGFAMASYGAGGLLSAVVSGALVKFTGRLVLLTTGFICQVCLFVFMWMWVPTPGQEWQIYVMAITSGVGGSIRLTQICAFLGVLFPRTQDAAFTAFNFWYGIACSLYFALGTLHRVCVVHFLYALLVWLVLSMVLYYALEWKIRRAGFLSINDERQYEEQWQEIEDKEKRTKIFKDSSESRCNPFATKSPSKLVDLNGKEKRYSKLMVDEVETVV